MCIQWGTSKGEPPLRGRERREGGREGGKEGGKDM
jgi:hypothetical protein